MFDRADLARGEGVALSTSITTLIMGTGTRSHAATLLKCEGSRVLRPEHRPVLEVRRA
jgi:hypothetical protein